jgi:hypothetical protein
MKMTPGFKGPSRINIFNESVNTEELIVEEEESSQIDFETEMERIV